MAKTGVENPFNEWDDIHVAQGFSWRAESVSFGTLEQHGTCRVRIRLAENELLADEELEPPAVLLMEAEPAI